MGRFVFKLPDVGEGTAEAEIVASLARHDEHEAAAESEIEDAGHAG